MLTEVAIKRAIREATTANARKKVFDGGGLYLLIDPPKSLGWRYKYRIGGREKLLSFGVYPDVPTALARERRDEARKQLATGRDPSLVRKVMEDVCARPSGRENLVAFRMGSEVFWPRPGNFTCSDHCRCGDRRVKPDAAERLGGGPPRKVVSGRDDVLAIDLWMFCPDLRHENGAGRRCVSCRPQAAGRERQVSGSLIGILTTYIERRYPREKSVLRVRNERIPTTRLAKRIASLLRAPTRTHRHS